MEPPLLPRLEEVLSQVSSMTNNTAEENTQCLDNLATYLEHDPSLVPAISKRHDVLNATGNLLVTARSPETQRSALHLITELLGFPLRCRRFINVFGRHEKLRAMVSCMQNPLLTQLSVRALQRIVWHDEGAGVVSGALLSQPLLGEVVKTLMANLLSPNSGCTSLFSYFVQNATTSVKEEVLKTGGILTQVLTALTSVPKEPSYAYIFEVLIALVRGNEKAITQCAAAGEVRSLVNATIESEYTQLFLCVMHSPTLPQPRTSAQHVYQIIISAIEGIRKSVFDADATVKHMERLRGVLAEQATTGFQRIVMLTLPEVLSTLLVCLNNVDEKICIVACDLLEMCIPHDVVSAIVDSGAVETICSIVADEEASVQVHALSLLGSILEAMPKAIAFARKAVDVVMKGLESYCSGGIVSNWSDLHVRTIVSSLRVLRVGMQESHDIEPLFQILHKAVSQSLEVVVALAVECIRARAVSASSTHVSYLVVLLNSPTTQEPLIARCLLALIGYICKADHRKAFLSLVRSTECLSAIHRWTLQGESRDVALRVCALFMNHYETDSKSQVVFFQELTDSLLSSLDGASHLALASLCHSNPSVQVKVLQSPYVIPSILNALETRPPTDLEQIGCAIALLTSLTSAIVENGAVLQQEGSYVFRLVCGLIEMVAYFEYEAPAEGHDIPQRCFQVLIELRELSCPLIVQMAFSIVSVLPRHPAPWPQTDVVSSIYPPSTQSPADTDPDDVHDSLVKVLPIINGLSFKDNLCRQALIRCHVVDVILDLLSRHPLDCDVKLCSAYILHNVGAELTPEQFLLSTFVAREGEEQRDRAARDSSLDPSECARLCCLYSDMIATLNNLASK